MTILRIVENAFGHLPPTSGGEVINCGAHPITATLGDVDATETVTASNWRSDRIGFTVGYPVTGALTGPLLDEVVQAADADNRPVRTTDPSRGRMSHGSPSATHPADPRSSSSAAVTPSVAPGTRVVQVPTYTEVAFRRTAVTAVSAPRYSTGMAYFPDGGAAVAAFPAVCAESTLPVGADADPSAVR